MIDLHAHVVPADVAGRAGAWGPEAGERTDGTPWFRVGGYELVGVRYEGTAFMDLDVRLAGMDAAGIAVQVLSPNPITYLHHVPGGVADEFCRWHNDTMATLVARHPTRLAGFAQLPVQDPARAAIELARAVSDAGLVGGYIGTEMPHDLDDPAMDELWAAAVELDVPVVVHPAPHGIDGPPADPRLRRWDLDLFLGFAYEETIAVAQLVLGGVLDRHPALDVAVSHGGGATAWLRERLRRAAATRPGVPDALRPPGAVDDRLARLWWDAHVGGPDALAVLASTFGTDHLLPGTNFAGWDSADTDGPVAVASGTGEPSGLGERLDANARRFLRDRLP
jgi:aminocarboxymuconate-semialdehyde decarboxylase